MIGPVLVTISGKYAVQYVGGIWNIYDENGDFLMEASERKMIQFLNENDRRDEDEAKD